MAHTFQSSYSCRDIGHIIAGSIALTATDAPESLWIPYKPMLILSETLATLQRQNVKELADLTFNSRRECIELAKVIHDAGPVFTAFDHAKPPVRAYLRVNVTKEHAPELLALTGIEPAYGLDLGCMLRKELAHATDEYARISAHLNDPRTH